MKRLISLVLVVIMLLSTLLLTSCSASALADELSNFLSSILGSYVPVKIVERYTATEAEWNAIWTANNYTLQQPSAIIMRSENAIKITDLNGIAHNYYVQKDGKLYSVEEKYLEWVYTEQGEGNINDYTLSALGLPGIITYDILKYNDSTKRYTYEDESGKVDFYFENGKLIESNWKAASGELFYRIYNVGTTAFIVPLEGSDAGSNNGGNVNEGSNEEYNPFTRPETPTDGSPVTEEQWNANMREVSFSAISYYPEMSDGKMFYFPYFVVNCSDAFVKNDGRFYTKIGGFWYEIKGTNNGSYVADLVLENPCYTISGYMPFSADYSKVTYDADKGCYVFENEYTVLVSDEYGQREIVATKSANIYFVDGLISFVEYVDSSELGESETIMTFRNVGTETSEDLLNWAVDSGMIGEYTISTSGKAISAAKWNDIISDRIFTATLEGDNTLANFGQGFLPVRNGFNYYIFNNGTVCRGDYYSLDYATYYVLENGTWYSISERVEGLPGEYVSYYKKEVCEEGFASNVGELLSYHHVKNVDFADLTYNPELKAYETECVSTIDGEEVNVKVLINYVDDTCVEVYISLALVDSSKYAPSGSDAVFKITINTEEEKSITLPEYRVD